MRRTNAVIVSVFAAAALAVTTACEDDITTAPPPPTPDPVGEEETDDNGGQEPSEVDPSEVTPPGTELSMGATAVVPFRDGVIAVTVTGIEQASDQAAFQSEVNNVEGWVSYHIWVSAENVSDEDLSYAGLPKLKAVMPGGEPTRFSLIGSPNFDECEHVAFPADAGSGTTIETCSMTAVEEGTAPIGAQWEDRDHGYNDDPIVWLQ